MSIEKLIYKVYNYYLLIYCFHILLNFVRVWINAGGIIENIPVNMTDKNVTDPLFNNSTEKKRGEFAKIKDKKYEFFLI